MAERPKGCQSADMTADGSVKAGKGIVYSFNFAAKGATAGDIVVLRDGGPTGTVKAYGVVAAANGMGNVDCGKYGIEFLTSIYYSELAAAAQKIRSTIVYD